VAQQIPAGTAKTDGRKRRWHQHKVERRNELIDGTIEAIRRRGQYVSMDEIAGEIGVSKTVLYRYFVDKNDLTTAVMMRFAQITLIPNMASALSSNLDGFELTREVIRVYVETVANEPEPYRFVMANNSAGKNKVVADSERIIARMLAVMLRRQQATRGDGSRRGGAVGIHGRRRRPAGHALLAAGPTDERRRADRLPDHAELERAVRDRRGRRLAGEVPRPTAPLADSAAAARLADYVGAHE
jgi:AcrR family transcriptional regulator